jgi:TonB-dependent receptor
MMKPQSVLRLLLLSTALVSPAAYAQTAPSQDAAEPPVAAETADAGNQPAEEEVDISIPGGGGDTGEDIIVRGRFTPNPIRATPEVVSVLSAADIARTGEGDIAGALTRVTGLSVVGNGFVYVRGLGDRYSLALLNGSPLPSPEPLRRVVPLDLFPTNVISSTLVQKSFSVNFPGEFGGGVVNLTTRAIPSETFFEIGGSISGDTESTFQLGYTYFGSPTDFTGFDNGERDIPGPLAAALASGNPILEGADYSRRDLGLIASSLSNARTTVLQRNDDIPINWSANFVGGTAIDVGSDRLGIIATAGISNSWRVRDVLQQTPGTADLSQAQTDFQRVITDNRIVVNGLLGLGYEFGEHQLRWTNLYIRDSLKQARLGLGTDTNQQGRDIMEQDTAWYERQLFDTHLVGEFDFDTIDLDFRVGYSNSQREAPYERSFTYIRSNLPLTQDPVGNEFVNDLGGNRGEASIAFSDLNEDLYSGGADLSYEVTSDIDLTVGYAYSDTERTSVRRAFVYRANNLPLAVQQLRPDFLVSDATIQLYDIILQETSAQDGTAAFDAALETHAGYAQVKANIIEGVSVNAGVRYEDATQTVVPVDLFNTGSSAIVQTDLENSYWLPAITVTWEPAADMQVRANLSRTIARPQFRELVAQIYLDPETNRNYRGNPSLVDSQLTNAELRYEWYFAREQRATAAVFYKKIDNPIEAYTAFSDNDINTRFANAPSATLWGIELELQKYFYTDTWDGAFWANRRFVVIANYTYTNSEISVGANDTTLVDGVSTPASDLFFDGVPLTGQSDHLANLQLGLEDTDSLSQQTFLLNYASPRVTQRGPSGLPDLEERPGFTLDFVARQGVQVFGQTLEVKFEARNITNRRYTEVESNGQNRIFFNRYDVGTTFSLGASLKF